MELPVVNHKDYEAQLNDDNKFPIKKFGELAKALIKNKIVITILFLINALANSPNFFIGNLLSSFN